MPAEQMGKVMNILSASLGVNCGYCHEGTDFAKDSVGKKETGRRMLSMTLELNQKYFDGEPEITCNTCHRGQARPSSALSLERLNPIPQLSQPLTKPNTEEIWSRYVEALGGKARVDALKSRHVIAKRIEPNGKSEPEELWQTASNRSRMLTQYGDIAVVEGFDGTQAWKRANDRVIELKSDESEQIRKEVLLAFGSDPLSKYSELEYQRLDRILDRDVHVVDAGNKNLQPERLYFDTQNGLLVRRIASVQTIMGPFEYRVDYQDYKEFGGVMQPTQIRFAVPNMTWTRQVQTIETNLEFDQELFRKP